MTYHNGHRRRLFFLLLITITIIPSTYSSLHPHPQPQPQLQPQDDDDGDDLHLLLSFKNLSDPTDSLSSWNLSYPPSSWLGLTFTTTTTTTTNNNSSSSSRVTRIVLENLSLTGPSGLSLLTGLPHLRVLSLKSNSLSGPLPSSLSNLLSLKLLFLSSNLFSGPIPTSLSRLSRLYRLDLSRNNLSGPLPQDLSRRLSRLITLRLDSNSLSGPISSAFLHALPNLQDLNLSSNSLSGAIPPSLSSFPASAFHANLRLCGPPLLSTCNHHHVSAKSPIPDPPASASASTVVVASSSSSSSSKPEAAGGPTTPHGAAAGLGRGINRLVVLAIVVGDFVVLLLVSAVLFCYFWRKIAARGRSSSSSSSSHVQQGEKIVYSSTPYAAAAYDGGGGGGGGGFEKGRMVFLDREKRFELEDLLKASAEMLGKGGHGTAYRAVLQDGTAVVAVKRLRELQIGRREFQAQMELLARLLHPNLVPLKAYYYSRDEKLLVYEYMPGGNLFSLLHGNRGPSRTPLDWTSRVRIAAGAARGLAFIHQTSRSTRLAHGNVKSTNILIDKGGNPRLADFGLAQLVPCPHSLANGCYRAPESSLVSHRAASSQKADIYALGIVLLEILTGKSASEGEVNLPRWVQSVVREEWTSEVFDLELMRYKGIEEEMVAMLQIAMACVAMAPEQRPKVGHVVRVIEEIHGGEVSPSHESFDFASDSPSTSDDARTIGSQ